jgi:pseudouridine-5'-phosphate glycosidase
MALAKFYKLSKEVQSAQRRGWPLVALESTVITHGLPQPENLKLAQEIEDIVRAGSAAPATIGVLKGRLLVGMEEEELQELAKDKAPRKLSSRDIAAALEQEASGGTTVAATLRVAAQANIQVFATGGIGGVHRNAARDVSADLAELASRQLIVVCAGAKAILDLPGTLEELETLGVPVIGYQTDEFPAFYSTESGLRTSGRVESAEEMAKLAQTHWALGGGGLLLAAPLPEEAALPHEQIDGWIEVALKDAQVEGMSGPAVTPYLLKRVNELSGDKSLKANLALLKNNAAIAAEVATQLSPKTGQLGLLPKQA